MTESKPRRLSLPSKPESASSDAPVRRRPPIRGPNKDLKVRDGKSPRPRAPAGEDADRSRSGPRREGERSRPDFRGERPAGDRPRFGSDGPRNASGEGRRFNPDDRRGSSPARTGDAPRPRFQGGDDRPARPAYGDRPRPERDRNAEHPGRRDERPTGAPSYRDDRPPRSDDQRRPAFRDQAPADRPRFNSDERRPRPEFRDRPPAGPRSDDRPPRGDDQRRPTFRDQAPTDRPRFNSDERRPRPEFRDRPPAGPRRDDRPADARDDRRPPHARDQAPAERPRFRSDEERRPAFRERPDAARRHDNGERPPRNLSRTREEMERDTGRGFRERDAGPQREHSDDARPRNSWRAEWRPEQDKKPVVLDAPSREYPEGAIRLSKRMTDMGLCSRREADDYIERGWVKVDGVVVDILGSRIMPDQVVELNERAELSQARRVTILINKPIGYVSGQAEDGYEPASVLVTGENHWEEDPCKIRMEQRFLRKLAPAGRLDIDSTGLLVLTQDGRIAKQIIGERSDIEKEYLVRVEGTLSEEGMRLLNHGLELDGVQLLPAKVSWQNEDQLRIVLREGRKRQIRRMCELVGLRVIGLKRIRIGSITLSKLPPGKWRYLGEFEKF